MTIFAVRHVTEYRYKRPVSFDEHRVMFRPRDSYDQRLLESSMTITPEPSHVRWVHDVFGNCVALVQFAQRADALRFETRIRLDHTSGPDFQIDAEALHYPFAYPEEDKPDLAPSTLRHYADGDDEIGRWARRFIGDGAQNHTASLLMTLCFAIHESFRYIRRPQAGTQTPLQTLRAGSGTCRDFAVFMMEAVRALGFAARFVTGYIYVADRDGSDRLGGGSTHAWCQVYLPGAGWVEFDPTNGIVGNRDLIRVGVARTPGQATPLSGSYRGKASDDLGMSVQVNVTTEDASRARGDEREPNHSEDVG